MSYVFEMEMTPNTFQYGPDRKLRINELTKIFQEIASRHADRFGFGMEWMMKNRRIWVLTDIRMSIKTMPSWNKKRNQIKSIWSRLTNPLPPEVVRSQ